MIAQSLNPEYLGNLYVGCGKRYVKMYKGKENYAKGKLCQRKTSSGQGDRSKYGTTIQPAHVANNECGEKPSSRTYKLGLDDFWTNGANLGKVCTKL